MSLLSSTAVSLKRNRVFYTHDTKLTIPHPYYCDSGKVKDPRYIRVRQEAKFINELTGNQHVKLFRASTTSRTII